MHVANTSAARHALGMNRVVALIAHDGGKPDMVAFAMFNRTTLVPDLLKNISPELRRRMQGKSCFNFTRVDEPLLRELADLTDRGIIRYRDLKLTPRPSWHSGKGGETQWPGN
jgi:hypothetical protein